MEICTAWLKRKQNLTSFSPFFFLNFLTIFFFQVRLEVVFTEELMLTEINKKLIKEPEKPKKSKITNNPLLSTSKNSMPTKNHFGTVTDQA